MAGKEKARLIGMRRAMNVLGWFHYGLALLQLVLAIAAVSAGLARLGAAYKSALPSLLSFIGAWSDTAAGAAALLYLLTALGTQFFIGWNWRRKARSTVRQILTLVLSGAKTLWAFYSLLAGDLLTARAAIVFSLVLNGITFALALWMHWEYRRTNGGAK